MGNQSTSLSILCSLIIIAELLFIYTEKIQLYLALSKKLLVIIRAILNYQLHQCYSSPAWNSPTVRIDFQGKETYCIQICVFVQKHFGTKILIISIPICPYLP